MSSQTAVRSQNRTRRSMADIKADYDRAAAHADEIQALYDREFTMLAREYQFKRVELRGANRQTRRAQYNGDHEQMVRWVSKAERLQKEVMPEIMAKLESLHDSLMQAAEAVRNYRLEMAKRAGIPDSYGDAIKIVDEARGTFSIYFGGVGLPDGPGHAHFSFDHSCELRYQRQPARTQPVPRWRR